MPSPRPAAFAALVAFTVLASVTEGLRSPAIIAVAACVLALGWRRKVGVATALAAVSILAIAVAGVVVAQPPTLTDVAMAVALVGAIAIVPVWQHARATRLIEQARGKSERLESFLAPAESGKPAAPSRAARVMPAGVAGHTEPRVEAVLTQHRADERQQFDAIAAYLRDVRDATGAEEVVLWRWTTARDALTPVVWTTPDASGPRAVSEYLPLIEWAAVQELVQCDEFEGGAPHVAVAPVPGEEQGYGALSITSAAGLGATCVHLREWTRRHATHVGRLAELLETRREFSRQSMQTGALLAAAQLFQANRTIEDLGRAICETALQVTSGDRAALVHWLASAGAGVVESVAGSGSVAIGMAVTEGSLVAQMCRDGLPQVWEDARQAVRQVPVFSPGEALRSIGSLGVYPLKREHETVGALVIEAKAAGAVVTRDMRNVKLLAALATLSLETVWEIAEVTQRARTDQLTGLANRRHFDEQLARALTETDRYGNTVSLIIADIDFFKIVNDTHGHEAGDAVLRAVAGIFREKVRTVDVCARYGGEELAVLLPQTTLTGACELAERLRQTIETRVIGFNGKAIPVTASFGVASFPESAVSREELFPAADKALYKAKAEGRNRVRSAPLNNLPQSS